MSHRLVAGYIVLVERKVLADFQVRLGPMRVGPHGLLQPIADALRLLLKEDIIPTDSDPDSPAWPNRLTIAAAGLGIGLLLGALALYLRRPRTPALQPA